MPTSALAAGLVREEHFRTLFEMSPDGVLIVDAQGRIILANSQIERLFGYRTEELAGRSIEMLLPESLRDAHVRHRQSYDAAPRTRSMGSGVDLMARRRDGVEFPVEIALSPMRMDEARLVIASVRDVTESRLARDTLKAHARFSDRLAKLGEIAIQAHRLEDLLAAIPAAVAETLDAEVVVVCLLDEAGAALPCNVAHGLTPAQLQALDEAAGSGSVRAHVLRTGRALLVNDFAGEAQVRLNPVLHEAGVRSVIGVPLAGSGNSYGVLSVGSTRTQRFRDDDVGFVQAVGGVVAAALGRLRAEEQLAHAQRLDAIGQLTGGIAHDFNNLLTIISGNLQLLEGAVSGPPQVAKWLGAAQRAAARGAALTRNLLVIARQQTLNPRIVDLAQYLPGLAEMVARTLGERIEIRVTVQPGLPPCFVDPVQLDVVLINLALNARDAMPGGGQLAIDAREPVATGKRVGNLAREIVISVTDSGVGMTPEVKSRAANPFFTTKAPGKGSGLGLSMAQAFVTQSGGRLSIDSEPALGTSVRFHLPVAAAPLPEREVAARLALPEGKECVLVVEDDADVRGVAVDFLSGLGYRVLEAGGSEAALAALKHEPDIALVFSDIGLGEGMNGAQLAQAACALRPGLKVLLTTGYADDNQTPRAGEFVVLPKPYERRELALEIRAQLDRP